MEVVVKNDYNLNIDDIDIKAFKSRALIINSNDEILFGILDKTYQFPGGHVEIGETFQEALHRELLEETGINIERKDYEPFYKIKYYSKNHDGLNKNKYIELHYYLIETDEKFDLNKRKLDKYEIENNYSLEYVKLEDVFDLLNKTVNDNERNKVVYDDIKNVINYYIENLR